MAVLSVLTYPDPVLKVVCDPVIAFDDKLATFVADLTETLDSFPGCVGIAAPQVGNLIRLVIIDASRNKKCTENLGRQVLINPVITWQDGEELAREGCLSLPDFTANVKRAKDVRVKALDQSGNERELQATEFEARVILHEMDHLDGLLFLDRVASLKTDVFRRKRYL
ncbi:MAG TPA: peptide deformylase [Oculatellaceae cyanobacterium]